MQKGLALDPGAARGWLALGLVANQLGDAERAEQAFEAALQGDPSLSDAAFGLGLVAFDRRRYAKAAAAFRQALDLGATMPIARVGLGQSLFFLGEFAEAARELRIAVAAAAEASLIRRAALANYIAEALKGDFAEADRLYEEIAGAGAEEASAVAFSAFKILGAYGHRAEALALAEARMTARRVDPEQRYLCAAMAGEAAERAPADYLVAHFDSFAHEFDHQLVEVLGYNAPRLLLELLGRNAAGPRRVLDLGCGTGLAGALLREGRDRLVGVDLSPRMLAKAGERQVYDELVNGDLVEFLQTTSERFDLLFAADTLIYFGNLKPVFAGAARVMAAGALFAFNIETTNWGAYEVTPSGRFAHDLSHVSEVGAPWFRVRRFRRADLRREGVVATRGALVVMERRGFVSRQSAFAASPATRAA